MDKDILLITNYFPPEKGAAANRISSLAEGLGKAKYKVRVVCPLPNYPNGEIFKAYKGKITISENTSYGKVSRLWVWPSNSTNKIVRLVSMLSFSLSLVLYFIFTKTPKKIFVQYSPVFVGFTAVFLGWLFSKKIILNVSDLWPLAGLEMGILKKGWYYSLLLKMERFCYQKAHLIVGQSEEILQHVLTFEKGKATFLYRNIPKFTTPQVRENTTNDEIKIVYAGLLGIAQGLFEICQRLSLPKRVSLHIYGAGPEAGRISSLQKPNIHFYGELDRDRLHKTMQEYDIAFVPLRNRIYGSVPSKIFEYTRLGLPVLYFAGGEGGDIITAKSLGWAIPPNDYVGLQLFFDEISKKEINKFPKKKIQEISLRAFNFNEQFDGFEKALARIQ
jgi:glycosyltransferase involved in cell wall biosynthesis